MVAPVQIAGDAVAVSISGQTVELLYSAALGAGLGGLYDALRLLRTYLKCGRLATALFDLLFWIIALGATVAFVMTVSGGVVRWYVLIGEFCGAFVYMCTFSRLIFRAMDIIIKFVIAALHFLAAPVYFVCGRCAALARWGTGRIKRRGKGGGERKNVGEREGGAL